MGSGNIAETPQMVDWTADVVEAVQQRKMVHNSFSVVCVYPFCVKYKRNHGNECPRSRSLMQHSYSLSGLYPRPTMGITSQVHVLL